MNFSPIIVFVLRALLSDATSSGSGINNCTLITADHPCKILTERGTNHTLPQLLNNDVDFVLRIGFGIIESIRGSYPDICLDFIEYYLCILGVPPCNPESDGLPLLICDDDCLAFRILKEDGTCNSTMKYVQDFAESTKNKDLNVIIELFNAFDCENVSTYYFNEYDSYDDDDGCTGLLSLDSKEAVLSGTYSLRCVPATVSACLALFPQPYYIQLPEREESETFASVVAISSQLDAFCSDVLITFACQFISPPCDPVKGTQLPVCIDSCYALDIVTTKCTSELSLIKLNSTGLFIDFLTNFNCTSPESYLVPGFPIDMDNCINAEDYIDVPNDSSPSTNSSTIAAVVSILCIMICMVTVAVVCIYNKARMKKYYHRWTLSINERQKIREATNPIETKNTYKRSIHTLNSEMSMASLEPCDDRDIVRLSETDVKQYEILFSNTVVQYRHLQINEGIGEGAFGKVYAGLLNNPSNDVRVAIKTIKLSCDDGEVRLDGGVTKWEGRVEVCFNQRWNVVGGDEWSETNSHVICNVLGYDIPDKIEEISSNIPQSLSKPVYLHNVKCSPSDLCLLECGFTKYVGYTTDVQEAIVVCQKPTCMDGDVKLVGSNSNSEGRLEVCFDQRWTTVDDDGWTDSDTKVACRQLGLSTSDTLYTRIDRTSGHALPVSMTLVGCYGSEERLIDCSYHEFTDSKDDSMDIGINCGSSESSAAGLSSESTASLSIAVIIAIAFIILIAILIAMFVLRRKKKKYTTRHEMSHRSTQDPDSPGHRYDIMDSGKSYFNKTTESVSFDEKIPQSHMEDVPMENYEEVQAPETNPIPIPPKPKPKKAPKKPHVTQNVGPVRYTQAANTNVGKSAVAPPVMRPNRGQRQPRPPSDPPESIYECPD